MCSGKKERIQPSGQHAGSKRLAFRIRSSGKIVTTPPDHMTNLTIEDLQQMGVEVIGYSSAVALHSNLGFDLVYLSPAMVRADIRLDGGSTIPGGTVVVTVSDTWDVKTASASYHPRRTILPTKPRACATSAIVHLAADHFHCAGARGFLDPY